MSSPRPRSSTTSAKTMAPHGRPKLKRPPREPDLTKATEHQRMSLPESPSRATNEATNQLSPASPDPPRVKTPTDDRSSTPVCPEPPTEKSPTSDDRASPDPNCAICLGKLRNKSFTDSCLHQFCFKCLVQWSKVKPECPLCKQGFKSIIHNVRSNEDYDQYHCRPIHTPTRDSLLDELLGLGHGVSRFRYRTTHFTGHRRLAPFSEATIHELFLQHQNMAYVIPSASPRWVTRTRRQIVTADFRAGIYNRDLWVQDLPDITGRYRDCSPEFYRVNQAQLHRLVPWLNREIPSVTQNSSTNPQLIIDLILSLITQHHIQSRIMYSRIRSYFGVRTSHFLHEFHAFARSPYDLIGYDQAATYGPNPNPTVFTPGPDESIDSSDSDVILVESDVEPIAGPSGLSRQPNSSVLPVHSVSSESNQYTPTSSQEAPLVVDDSDDCEIVNCVKPRHERTPEIIILSDSDEEVASSEPALNRDGNRLWNRMLDNVNDSMDIDISSLFSPHSPSPPLPSLSTTSTSSSTSEYTPYTLRSSSKNSASKKSRKKESKTTRKKSSKSCGKATKMKARSDFSDSEEEEKPKSKRSSKSRRNTRSTKERSRKTGQRVLSPSPSSSVSYRTDLPGTSGFKPHCFSSDDSLNDHSTVVIPFLEAEEHANSNKDQSFSSSDTSTRRLWSVHSSPEHLDYHPADVDYKPNIPDRLTSPNSQEQSSPPFTLSEKTSNTWCIKPSLSDHGETTDTNDTSPCSSGSEYHPRLKSIVIMRSNNTNDHMHTRHGPRSPVSDVSKGRSQSPVASTSRAQLQSPVASSSRARSRSPSRHSLHSCALSSTRGKFSKHKYKPKSSKKECKRRKKVISDSDSDWEQRSKKPRMSKWQFNDNSDDSSS